MTQYKPDAGIPVLTEIITPPAAESRDSTASEPEVAEPAVVAEEAEVAATPVISALLDDEIRHIEDEICERVLQKLLSRIDFVLEQRVRDCFADALQLSVERTANELREGLRQSLNDAVTRAVTQEISRLQSTKK